MSDEWDNGEVVLVQHAATVIAPGDFERRVLDLLEKMLWTVNAIYASLPEQSARQARAQAEEEQDGH